MWCIQLVNFVEKKCETHRKSELELSRSVFRPFFATRDYIELRDKDMASVSRDRIDAPINNTHNLRGPAVSIR